MPMFVIFFEIWTEPPTGFDDVISLIAYSEGFSDINITVQIITNIDKRVRLRFEPAEKALTVTNVFNPTNVSNFV